MGKCINHPHRESRYHCMKHNYFLCDECIECKDPDIYCKYRSSCPIYFLTRKGFDKGDKAVENSEKSTVVT